jgi:3D (Asp-Asp-Asp) domain-containing protein
MANDIIDINVYETTETVAITVNPNLTTVNINQVTGSGGDTNLGYTPSPTNGIVTSDTGTDATIPLADDTNAGLLTAAEKTKIANSVPYTGAVSDVNLGLNDITAEKLIKSGGTSSEILAADGSVITAGTNITITGGQISSVGGAGGGGSSVNYYLNGGTNQGTFGGTTYYEFSKTPVIGTEADFTISSNGYIASFITDVADPSLLLIPAGNWNLEFFFSSSSAGGSPSFYAELYKYDGTTFTLIASGSAAPEGITNGTAIDAYFTALAVPETVLTVNDRLAIRVYVTDSGKTITLHTQNGHLCEVITTFTAGLTALNGLQAQVQNFAVGTTGTDFAINSSGSTHTFNLPSASATVRGVVTTTTQTFAGDKTFTGEIVASNLSGTNTGDNATNTQYSGLAASKQDTITLTTTGTSGASTLVGATLNIPQYSGATNLGYTASPTNGTVTSSTGSSATLPLADATNAGLLKPAKFTVLENTSGTNTGDQDLSTYALLASPTFTGTPSLPTGTTGTTQTPLNNSTRLATTAYVEAACAVVAGASGVQVSSQDTFGTNKIATVTAAQYAAFVTAGTVSSTTLYFITA